MKHSLTLSIVIPVYNEERYIKHCLDAIASQTVMPIEVIVVDNNCIDKTIEIAETYPFVKVLKQPTQGRTVSRNMGFNAAKGDIIGRIDADSILMPNWVERALYDFSNYEIDGVTGLSRARVLLGFTKWYSTFWTRAYYWTAHSLYRAMTMWGADMAIRRKAWLEIRDDTAPDGSKVHEDQDLSFVLIGHGGRIMQDNKLLITSAAGNASLLYWPKFWSYFKKGLRMKEYHSGLGTLDNPAAQKLRLNFWQLLPGAILGWTLTGLFMIYSLSCWPILAVLLKRRERQQIKAKSSFY